MGLVKEMPVEERPREKAELYGIKSLSNVELLAILIRSGYEGTSSLQIAENLIRKSNGLSFLSRLSLQDLFEIKGIKKVKALELLACFELSKRMAFCEAMNRDIMDNPNALIHWLRLELGNETQERFLVVYLNVKNHILSYDILFTGTVDSSLVHPREIFKEACLKSASRIILVHNHPSTDLKPSSADIELTKKLVDGSEVIGIEVLDHIIVSNQGFMSFRASGLL